MANRSSTSSSTLFNSPTIFSARPTPKRTLTSNTTTPLSYSVRQKPRRWPLVLRFYKGAIHGAVFLPVVLHSLFTVLIILLDTYYVDNGLGLPSLIIPSLSIVVGLMLVFRNQTSYDRFWTGRNLLAECCSSVRNLTRSFLVASTTARVNTQPPQATSFGQSSTLFTSDDLEFLDATPLQQADTEQIVKILIAILYSIKHNLRNEYLATPDGEPVHPASHPEFEAMLPAELIAAEHRGLSLPLQLMVMVEAYIRRGVYRSWFHGPQASQLTVQLNTLTAAYGRMEAIRTTPIPVAHLIHTRQVLGLYGAVLPFSLVDGFGWWSVPMVAVLMFTLYGIDGIGSQLEDPFGYDRNDIKMDAIVQDARVECLVLLDMWKERVSGDVNDGGMFR